MSVRQPRQQYRSEYDASPPDLVNLILSPFAETAAVINDIITSPRTHQAIVRIIVLGGIITTAIIGAIFAYLTFYWLFIPELGLAQPVWLQYGHSRPPFARVDMLPVGDYLANDQAYDVSLDLLVPNTPQNLELGNFMVTLDFRTTEDTSKLVVSRPATLSYSPAAVRAMHALSDVRALLQLPHATSQTIRIRLLDRKTLQRWSESERISHALVTVGRGDAHLIKEYQGGRGELQVYESTLHFDAHFSGLRYIMYHYRFLSFITFTSLFVIFEVVTALGAWAFVAYRRGTVSPYAVDAASARSVAEKRKPSAALLPPSRGGRGRSGSFQRSSGADLRRARFRLMDDPSLGSDVKREDDDAEDARVPSDDEAGSWEGIESVAATLDEAMIKREAPDDAGSVGGSSTTRGTRSSIGSLAGTASSATTASSTSTATAGNKAASIESASTQDSDSGTE